MIVYYLGSFDESKQREADMPLVTRREIVASSAVSVAEFKPLAAGPDTTTRDNLAFGTLWRQFLDAETRLAAAWKAVDRIRSDDIDRAAATADAIGHEHDRIVQQIAAQPASSWQGVTIKLLTWRRTANLSEFNLPDADTALAFSTYLDALRLCPGALGVANDAAIARLVLRHPDRAGE